MKIKKLLSEIKKASDPVLHKMKAEASNRLKQRALKNGFEDGEDWHRV